MTRHGVRRIVPLLLGWEELPKSVSVYGAPYEERLREPVPAVLLECDGGWLLLDTGFNTALIRDPALRRRFYASPTTVRSCRAPVNRWRRRWTPPVSRWTRSTRWPSAICTPTTRVG